MPWITPTDDEVLSKDSKERASIVAIKNKDDLADILVEVVAEFRDAIAGRDNDLDSTDNTLPAGLAKYARDLALWIFVSRGVPQNDGIQTKVRQDAGAKAEEILKGIRDGDMAVEPPSGWVNTSGKNWNSENRIVMRTHPTPPPAQQNGVASGQPYANPDAPADS
jgi:hypothetical protein